MKPEAFYLLRHLPPKTLGDGVIAQAFSTNVEPSLDALRKQHPDWFQSPGFYSLMRATGETLTVEAN